MSEPLPVDPALVEAAGTLTADDAAARHSDLAEQIRRANRLYYEEDAPELADAEYDGLFRELVAREHDLLVGSLRLRVQTQKRTGRQRQAGPFRELPASCVIHLLLCLSEI